MATYTLRTRLPLPVAEARWVVEVALRDEGFVVLAQIDLTAAARTAAMTDESPYLVLGACNPAWVSSALQADPSIGALLPCHVVIRADGDATIVETVDPTVTLAVADEPAVMLFAGQIRSAFIRVLARLDRMVTGKDTAAQTTARDGAEPGDAAVACVAPFTEE
jgi:uncharacterized protein (DUF302 family)